MKINKLLLCHMPGSTCNLKCEYCYITNQGLWNQKIKKLDHSPDEIIKALHPDRVGGAALIVFCASGETLLFPESIELIRGWLSSGHFVEVVTNGTLTKRFQEIATFPIHLREHLSFKFSFHYLEFKRLNIMDDFFANVRLMHHSGCSFTVELTPYDGMDKYREEIEETCHKYLGNNCQVTIARDDMKEGIPVMSKKSLTEYCEFWSYFKSPMLAYKQTIFGVKRNEFCYAGLYSATIRLATGEYSKCYGSPIVGNIFNNMDEPIPFEAIGKCHLPHCYNGHSLLAFGMIPELPAMTYKEIRNICLDDGTDSLTDVFKEIYGQRITDGVPLLSKQEEKAIYAKEAKRQRKENFRTNIKNIIKKTPIYGWYRNGQKQGR